MKFFILGGTGFIGSHFIAKALNAGHEVTALVRSDKGAKQLKAIAETAHAQITLVTGDGTVPGPWQTELAKAGAIVNLAGIHIVRNWTSKIKEEIYDSRILTTNNVVAAARSSQVLINASAIGYYGFHPAEIVLTEEAPAGQGFLASVCKAWENEALAGSKKGMRVVVTRLGIVLGHGGMIENMARMFRHFIGGQVGSGRQAFSWIHLDDLLSALFFCLENAKSEGTYNVCSPYSARSVEVTQILSRTFHTAILPIPSCMLKIAMGEAVDVLIQGQNVYPKRLLQEGFTFDFPKLEAAIQHLINTQK